MSINQKPSPPSQGYGTLNGAYEVPEMPETMRDVNPLDIMTAATALNHSRIKWAVDAINSLESTQLKGWEVAQLEIVMREFLTKHNSPLAKALK